MKAESPIDVTESGIVTLVRDSHQEKAIVPIVDTESGIVMLVRDTHPKKALLPIDVIWFGITIDVGFPKQDIIVPF